MATATPSRFRFTAPTVNPILIKELRSQMRGPRAFAVLTTFLLLLSGVAYFLYRIISINSTWGGPFPLSVMLGTTMFLGLSFLIMFLIAFVTPALTAGTISGEREAQTYEMLVATPLRPIWILTGKMLAAMSYIFLLIIASVPLMSLVYIFGGVTVIDMLTTLGVLLVMAFSYGTIGLFWSSLLGRTSRATVLSYLTLSLLIIVPFLINLIYPQFYPNNPTPPPVFTYFNPFAAIASVPLGAGGTQTISSFGGPMGMIFGLLTGMAGYWGPSPDLSAYTHPAWHWTVGFYGLLALIFGLISVVLVRPTGRARIRWYEPLLFILIVGGTIAVSSLFFTPDDVIKIFQAPDWNAMPIDAIPMPAVKG